MGQSGQSLGRARGLEETTTWQVQSTACKQSANSMSIARQYDYYSLAAAEAMGLCRHRAPAVHAEGRAGKSAAPARRRHCHDGTTSTPWSGWLNTRSSSEEIAFMPTRDDDGRCRLASCSWAIMAAMRDAMVRLGGDPRRASIRRCRWTSSSITGVMVDFTRERRCPATQSRDSKSSATASAMLSCAGSRSAFDNLRLIPPGKGICHQINLEHHRARRVDAQ